MRRVFAAAVAAALLVPTGSAIAGPTPHTLTGRWLGFVQTSDDDPDHRGSVELQVMTQDHRRFLGTLTVAMPGLPPNPCALEGTVSDSLQVAAKGECADGGVLKLHGSATEELQDGFIIPCVFEGRWTLAGRGGTLEGSVALLHLAGGPTHLAAGEYEGSARHGDPTSPEPVRALLGSQRTGGEGTGRFEVGNHAFDVRYDLAVDKGSETHGFAMLGQGDLGILVIRGRFQAPPDPVAPARVEGTHVVHLAGGGTLEGTFMMDNPHAA